MHVMVFFKPTFRSLRLLQKLNNICNKTLVEAVLGVMETFERVRLTKMCILKFDPNLRGGVEDTRLEAKAKDSLSEDRHYRGQGQKCSRPRPRTKDTSASALRKKKVFTKIFQAISTKKRFPKNFSSAPQNFNNSKNIAVLEPRTGQFSRTWGIEAKAKDFKICPRGLHLCYMLLVSIA